MRNEGGGFAANIYGAMSEGGIQVTSHQSLVTSHLAPLIPSYSSLFSRFRVQGSRFRAVVRRIKIWKRRRVLKIWYSRKMRNL